MMMLHIEYSLVVIDLFERRKTNLIEYALEFNDSLKIYPFVCESNIAVDLPVTTTINMVVREMTTDKLIARKRVSKNKIVIESKRKKSMILVKETCLLNIIFQIAKQKNRSKIKS